MRFAAVHLIALLGFVGLGCTTHYVEESPLVAKVFPQAQGTGFDRLDEAAVAAALARKVELEVPARVLVFDMGDFGLGEALANELSSSAYFATVPALKTLPDETGSQELLAHIRLLALRYRTPYVLLAGHRFQVEKGSNALCPLYAALVTLLFVPGGTVDVHGTIEAALVDVRTGTIVFAASRSVEDGDGFVLPGESWDATKALYREIVTREAPKLAAELDTAVKRSLTLPDGTWVPTVSTPHEP